ncbi:BTB/POZ domain and ankyrin repeat-containing protein NPR1-like [Humulus lupulus]|uniref:BTB/POZ domain and ankyrin repeat-containing protein NPR1-like n=1 Tax=Humulus lupulus TaxID=3486 RepID=UPI002B4148C2|nr:BTB/POZ domain and ankyrin repeat-containing protein NPR1-like [Humulus lupulus]
MSMATEPAAVAVAVDGDDLLARLVYFENRVAFARLMLPAEAKLALEIAGVGGADSGSNGSSGNLRAADLNETPVERTQILQARLQLLITTVEKGRLYFPHCSEVLNNFLDYEIERHEYDAFFPDKGTPEEQAKKKMLFMELKEDLQKAFTKDIAEKNQPGSSSSSPLSSTS